MLEGNGALLFKNKTMKEPDIPAEMRKLVKNKPKVVLSVYLHILCCW